MIFDWDTDRVSYLCFRCARRCTRRPHGSPVSSRTLDAPPPCALEASHSAGGGWGEDEGGWVGVGVRLHIALVGGGVRMRVRGWVINRMAQLVGGGEASHSAGGGWVRGGGLI